MSARLVAAINKMLLYAGLPALSRRSGGRYVLIHAIIRLRMRSSRGGWSNDCIWTRSSFTMPPVPLEIAFDTVRERPSIRLPGAGDMPRLSRAPPIASISSMKPIAPPSLRAAFRRALKKERIRDAVPPNHIDCVDDADMNRNGTPACLAIAFAR